MYSRRKLRERLGRLARGDVAGEPLLGCCCSGVGASGTSCGDSGCGGARWPHSSCSEDTTERSGTVAAPAPHARARTIIDSLSSPLW